MSFRIVSLIALSVSMGCNGMQTAFHIHDNDSDDNGTYKQEFTNLEYAANGLLQLADDQGHMVTVDNFLTEIGFNQNDQNWQLVHELLNKLEPTKYNHLYSRIRPRSPDSLNEAKTVLLIELLREVHVDNKTKETEKKDLSDAISKRNKLLVGALGTMGVACITTLGSIIAAVITSQNQTCNN